MRKKILCALLATTLLCGMLVGCGQTEGKTNEEGKGPTQTSQTTPGASAENNNAEESGRISDKTITLTVAGQYSTGATSEWNDTLQFQEYEKRLGIKLDATTYDSETWPSKLTLMLAGDTMPDILAGADLTADQVAKYGKDGYFLDFSKYLDIMPNLKAIMEKYPQYAAALRDEEGHIYALPSLNGYDAIALTEITLINNAWLERVGKEVPTSLDELYDVLVAFKEQDANGNGDPNDEIPLAIAVGDSKVYYRNEQYILFAHGINSKNYTYHLMADESGKVVLGDTTENYKDFLKYMNKLYSEGLMNQDAYVLTLSECKELIKANRVGVSCGSLDCYGDRVWENFTQLIGFTSDYCENQSVTTSNRVNAKYKVAVNSEVKYPEEVAKFIDYLFTPEGALSAANGYEGVTFDYANVFGIGTVDHAKYGEAEGISADAYRKQEIALNAFSLLTVNEGTIYDLLVRVTDEQLVSDEVMSLTTLNGMRAVRMREDGVVVNESFPALQYTADEMTERASLYNDINTYLITAKADFIIGERDIDKEWDAHIAKLKEIGLDRLMEIENAAYARYLLRVK